MLATVNNTQVVIGLDDPNGGRDNGFSPVNIYVKNSTSAANAKKLRIGLTTALKDAGYTINGAVDNILVVGRFRSYRGTAGGYNY